jgi:hypothetical protein
MLEYNYQENISIEDLNILGAEKWEVRDITTTATPNSFNAFLVRGFQDKTLIVNSETGAEFWLYEGLGYFSMFCIFLSFIICFFLIIRIIKNFFFQQL